MKLIDYKSKEGRILKEYFIENDIDRNIANIVESYIYKEEKEILGSTRTLIYTTRYGKEEGICELYHGDCKKRKPFVMKRWNYKDGVLDGLYEEWYVNYKNDTEGELGSKHMEFTYVKGEKEGEYKWWWKNGQMCHRVNMNKGLREGKYEGWDKNGKKNCECEYKEGKLDGKFILYNKEGKIRQECEYKNDKLNGRYREWDSKGKMIIKKKYKDGNIVINHERKKKTKI